MTDAVVETIRQYDDTGKAPKEGVELLELIDAYTREDSLDYADVRHIMDEIDVAEPDAIPPYTFTEADDDWKRRFGRPKYQKEPELIYEHRETGDRIAFFHGYSDRYEGRWKFPEEYEESRTARETVKQVPFMVADGISYVLDRLSRDHHIRYQTVFRGDIDTARRELDRAYGSAPDDDDRYDVDGATVRFRHSSMVVTLPEDELEDDHAVMAYLDGLTPVEHRLVGDTERAFGRGRPITDPALKKQEHQQEIDSEQDD